MSEQEKQPTFGEIVDRLGVAPRLDSGDMVTDIIVVAKVIAPDGEVRMSTAWNEGIGIFEKTGLLRVALIADENTYYDPKQRGQ